LLRWGQQERLKRLKLIDDSLKEATAECLQILGPGLETHQGVQYKLNDGVVFEFAHSDDFGCGGDDDPENWA